jgi:hypothetical protein
MRPRLPRSSTVTSNSDLYNFHRPKLRVHDTPHPLKRESELYTSIVLHSVRPQIAYCSYQDASRTCPRIVRNVQLLHIRAYSALPYSWHCSSDGRAIFTFCLASKPHFLTNTVYLKAHFTVTEGPRLSAPTPVTPHSREEKLMTKI